MRILTFLFVFILGALHAQSGIPMPNSVTPSGSKLNLAQGVSLKSMGKEYAFVEQLLIKGLEERGIKVICSDVYVPGLPHMSLMMDLDPSQDQEYYRIKMWPEWMKKYPNGLIMLACRKPAGMFYAVQTFLQNIDHQTYGIDEIRDSPRFGYRGMHLDVGRHFFPVSFIKQYLDLMAECKMNTFHWHLTEDQGWRIEIKKYPKLQEIAAFRSETLIGHYNDKPHQFDGKRYGGFYTQEEIKEVVRYAQERFITVIPEIELPGHAVAALSAYPELSCKGVQPERYPNSKPGNNGLGGSPLWGVFEDVYCTKEETFVFLQDVLTEVIALFPGQYIHIGGDECPKERWKTCPNCQKRMKENNLKDEHELQSWFIRRIEQFLSKNGKKLIGWDEILEGGLAPGATVMSWRGTQGGIDAAKAGHDVVMTPNSHCYLDYYQSDAPGEPLAIGGLLPLEMVYAYEPIPTELNADEAKHILGVQGNVWTEYMPSPEQVLYMALPRMQAIAEVGWTLPSNKNLKSFTDRLQVSMMDWKKKGINHANKLHDIRTKVIAGDGNGVRVELSTLAGTSALTYQLGESDPAKTYAGEPIRLEVATKLVAKSVQTPYTTEINFKPHKANLAKVFLHNMPAPKYSGAGIGSPFNGIDGSDTRYGDAEWLGFSGNNFIADLNFDHEIDVSQVSLRLFHAPGQWIYASPKIEVYATKGKDLVLIGTAEPKLGEDRIVRLTLPLLPTKLKEMQIRIKAFGTIPDGAQGAGHQAWLFVDEVRVD
jgi:hexosaminidase